MHRIWHLLGALAGLTGVALAAYAAHGALAADSRALLRSGVEMQLWHAPVLLLCGLWSARGGSALVHAAAAAITLGLAGFCGALDIHALGGASLGPVAPLGGALLLLGWLLLGLAGLRARP